MDDEEALRAGLHRRLTLAAGVVGLILTVVGVAYAVANPDAGPDLLRLVWRDTNAQPRAEPSPISPYTPPFANTAEAPS